jgi:hypothetical protein
MLRGSHSPTAPSSTALSSPAAANAMGRPVRRVWIRGRALALTILACFTPWLAAPVSSETVVAIELEGDSVRVTGATPGGKVVVFSVARETELHPVRVVRRDAIVPDTEGGGEITFELDREVPWQSVWVAVDLESGAFELATPQGFELREVPMPADAMRPAAGGVDSLADDREVLELLLVRPGLGAWGGIVGDGGVNDATGASNGRVALRLSRLSPVGDSPELTPQVFRPGDVVIGIDPRRLEIYAVRVAPAWGAS